METSKAEKIAEIQEKFKICAANNDIVGMACYNSQLQTLHATPAKEIARTLGIDLETWELPGIELRRTQQDRYREMIKAHFGEGTHTGRSYSSGREGAGDFWDSTTFNRLVAQRQRITQLGAQGEEPFAAAAKWDHWTMEAATRCHCSPQEVTENMRREVKRRAYFDNYNAIRYGDLDKSVLNEAVLFAVKHREEFKEFGDSPVPVSIWFDEASDFSMGFKTIETATMIERDGEKRKRTPAERRALDAQREARSAEKRRTKSLSRSIAAANAQVDNFALGYAELPNGRSMPWKR